MRRDWSTLHLLGGPLAFLAVASASGLGAGLSSARKPWPPRLDVVVVDIRAGQSGRHWISSAGRARRLQFPSGRQNPSVVFGRADLSAARRQHPLHCLDQVGIGSAHRACIADRGRHRHAAANHGVVCHRDGTERVSAEHGRRGGDDSRRPRDASLHRHRGHRKERVRLGARHRNRVGDERRRILDAARRRTQPADDQTSAADGHLARVPVHDVGNAAAAADDRGRGRIVLFMRFAFTPEIGARRRHARLLRSGAPFTWNDDDTREVGSVLLSRSDGTRVHPPVLFVCCCRG